MNDVESWVHTFLLGEGRNKALSDGLKKQKRFWVGPKEIELSLLPRITGPEAHMEYVVDAKGFDEKTKRMLADLKSGWKPAPLIAEYRDRVLSLRDGNHRREALELAGFKTYSTVIWFNSEEDFKKYKNFK
jgi:hypothetical protein